jgi:hypothetical protein
MYRIQGGTPLVGIAEATLRHPRAKPRR